ncbi:hypothetical protein K458DRAFT_414005 [Lentithecium fluviatile CBS 122367]|uniref:Uncharacterized protein n=1 Tax=Lentithecium fluviatile CBS 122367 TaxID=1168545 RepID=A0A6G1JHX7_9PLEO|nr:hypothetical protein K458DRAFT_414005 [Lentithecium fluviatile CBS 122367]
MRSSSLLVAFSALALADEQVPLVDKLKGWFNQATAAVSSAVPAVPSPADAVRGKVAEQIQHELTLENWKETLTADPTASAPTTQEWLVFITGGNTTCYGFCGNATKAWNTSLPLLAAQSNPPKFAIIDCDAQTILCNSWSVGPPSLYQFSIPKPLADQSAPATTVRYVPLNRTSTTTDTIKKLVIDKELENTPPYEGVFHPFNGPLQEYGLAIPVAYVFWAFAKMPSWLPMILISFVSRSFMGRRAGPQPGAQAGAGAGARPAQ